MVDNKSVPDSIKKMWQNFANTTAKALAPTSKKKKPQGKMLWDSSKNGTYIKKKHGELK